MFITQNVVVLFHPSPFHPVGCPFAQTSLACEQIPCEIAPEEGTQQLSLALEAFERGVGTSVSIMKSIHTMKTEKYHATSCRNKEA